MMDLSDLAVESIEVVSAGSLDLAAYGHGMPELAASCAIPCSSNCQGSAFLPEEWDQAEV